MKSSAKTVADYLKELTPERREAISAVRRVINAKLPEGYEECMQYGMICYVVPHRLYPAGYHCNPEMPLMFASLGSQKNHMAIYLMNVYGDQDTERWFRKAFKAAGKKLDMGKACVRFRKIDDLALEVIGQVIARTPVQKYISRVQEVLNRASTKRK